MGFLNDILTKVGAVVDAAVPVAHGDRTKIAALLAVGANLICGVVPAAYCPLVQGVANLAAGAVPLFAFAGIVRPK